MAYYIRIRGRAFGPFELAQMEEMKNNRGRLNRQTDVSYDKQNWQPAESFAELFPPPHSSEPADWFYSVNGKEGFGPETAATIEQMIASGQLFLNSSYVWQQGQNASLITSAKRPFTKTSLPSVQNNAESFHEYQAQRKTDTTSSSIDSTPLTASLGWLMFLKVTFLIVLILLGMGILWGSIFSLSHAVGADSVTGMLLTLMNILLTAGVYALLFKVFLCLWKYHTILQRAVLGNIHNELPQVHQRLFLLWTWLGITLITFLAAILLSITIAVIVAGFGTGSVTHHIRGLPF